MELTTIQATTLPDAWFQCLYKCIDECKEYKIDEGSYKGQYRKEFDYITVHIKIPWVQPLLPKLEAHYGIPDPVTDKYLNDYMKYFMTSEKKEGEDYTYGMRLSWQIGLIIKEYIKNKRTNQLVLQVADEADTYRLDNFKNYHPPCLRHIDTRIQDNKLHFFPYFRSWDLWGGFPANLAAIEMLKQYMASEIGVENGEIIASSKGLHIYDYVFDLVKKIRGI